MLCFPTRAVALPFEYTSFERNLQIKNRYHQYKHTCCIGYCVLLFSNKLRILSKLNCYKYIEKDRFLFIYIYILTVNFVMMSSLCGLTIENQDSPPLPCVFPSIYRSTHWFKQRMSLLHVQLVRWRLSCVL